MIPDSQLADIANLPGPSLMAQMAKEIIRLRHVAKELAADVVRYTGQRDFANGQLVDALKEKQ